MIKDKWLFVKRAREERPKNCSRSVRVLWLMMDSVTPGVNWRHEQCRRGIAAKVAILWLCCARLHWEVFSKTRQIQCENTGARWHSAPRREHCDFNAFGCIASSDMRPKDVHVRLDTRCIPENRRSSRRGRSYRYITSKQHMGSRSFNSHLDQIHFCSITYGST